MSFLDRSWRVGSASLLLCIAFRSAPSQSVDASAIRRYLVPHFNEETRAILDTNPTPLIGRLAGLSDSSLTLFASVHRMDLPFDHLRELQLMGCDNRGGKVLGLALLGATAGMAAGVALGHRSIKSAGLGGIGVALVDMTAGGLVGMFAVPAIAGHWLLKPPSWKPVPLDSLRNASSTPPSR